jgi:hypothetical protein
LPNFAVSLNFSLRCLLVHPPQTSHGVIGDCAFWQQRGFRLSI